MNMWGTAVAIFHKLFLTKGAWLKHTLLEKCLGVVEAVNKKFHTFIIKNVMIAQTRQTSES